MSTINISHFNPSQLDEPNFLASFIARQSTFEYFLNELRHSKQEQTARHHLIVAPRGYGKTSLLRRIQIALRAEVEFNTRFIALSFREEQHNVISLDVFWRNCIQSLLEAREDEKAPQDEIDELDALWLKHIPRAALKREDQDGTPAWQAFEAECSRIGRRPVLLVDNLDTLLIGLEQQQWGLRTTLQQANGPVLIAAASRYPEQLSDNAAAFFDFFRVTTLSRLNDDEVMACLRSLAIKRGIQGAPVIRLLETDIGRISALNTMAGGNPRTLGVLYTVLEAHMSDDVLAQLSAMLDTFTGWYQARTDELPMQSRAVFDALALNWDPITAAALGAVSGLETTVVSSHLSRLEKAGYVETVALSSTRKGRNGYQVAERFYNIWYLMRNGPRRARQSIRWLTMFLRSCFSRKELHGMAQEKIRNGGGRLESSLALADSIQNGRIRSQLIDAVESQLSGNDGDSELMSLLYEIKQKPLKPKSTKSAQNAQASAFEIAFSKAAVEHRAGNYVQEELHLREAINLNERNSAPQVALGNLLSNQFQRHEEAEAAYRRAIDLNGADARLWHILGNFLHTQLQRYEEAAAAYRRAIELDEKYALPWNNLGNLLRNPLKRYEEAEAAYRHAIELDDKYAAPWNNLGNLLNNQLQRHEDAEVAYRRAIELNEKYALPWNNLGNLLRNPFKRFVEAEAAYRRAIELDGKYALPWKNLGNLLNNQLQRYEEAEAAYRRAIELDGKNAQPWNGLGHLMQHRLSRYEEAEVAYRRAIELDGTYALPWNSLGILLSNQLQRHEEAEAAYRQAIELDGKDARFWYNLGTHMHNQLQRYDEAETAYRRAIELDEKYALPWNGLGNLLRNPLQRFEEAEAAYRCAIKLDGKYAQPWNGLGNLLHQPQQRYEEAEAAYRRAIELDEKYALPWNNLGNLLNHTLHRYEEAEAAYRRAIELDDHYVYLWCSIGNLLQDQLGKYEAALRAYSIGLAANPEDPMILGNIAYLQALHLNARPEAILCAQRALLQLAPAGRNLLESLLAWTEKTPAASANGWEKFHAAVTANDDSLWTAFIDDLQRLLAHVLVKGDGAAVQRWMEHANYPQQFSPLYHAFYAALNGEDHLLTINPEVREMASHLYQGISRMRSLFLQNELKKSPSRTKGKKISSIK